MKDIILFLTHLLAEVSIAIFYHQIIVSTRLYIQRKVEFLSKPILAQGLLNRSHHHSIYLPSQSDFVELYIAPYYQEKGLLRWKQNPSLPTEQRRERF
jgi:hypothetical protein